MNTEILENKICQQCSANFPIYQIDQEFYDMMSPSYDEKRFQIPRPSLCPTCREQRRLWIWNERNLYKRVCDATGKEIISIYHPESLYRVYDQDFWWSENWETPMSELGFDYSQNFFLQFHKLSLWVPKRALVKWTGSVNCNYTNCVWASKDGYLVFNGTNSEDCLYVDSMSNVSGCTDCSQITDCQDCYECIDCISCSNSQYLQDCQNCSLSSYMFNCVNCHSSFWCVNLQNKSYCIFNVPYSKADYKIELQKILKTGYSREEFLEFRNQFPQKNLKIIASENVSGDKIYNSENIHQSFKIHDVQNVRYSTNVYRAAYDCMDGYTCLNNSSKLYEMSLANKNCVNLMFCHDCWNNCQNLIYCTECKLCQDCFWCTGLVGKQYCILNKQYTKQEYEREIAKILSHMQQTGEWGEFFPLNVSPFSYNQSVAQQHYTLSEQEAKSIWANWSEYQSPLPKVDKIIPAHKLPKNIHDIPNDILNWAIECEVSKKAFRIIQAELEFYRKYNLAVPRRHPNQRYMDRIRLQNSQSLRITSCSNCKIEIPTSIPDTNNITIYCENCYNKEIY